MITRDGNIHENRLTGHRYAVGPAAAPAAAPAALSQVDPMTDPLIQFIRSLSDQEVRELRPEKR